MEFRGAENGRLPDVSLEFALVFSLPGSWTTIDPATIDIWGNERRVDVSSECAGTFFQRSGCGLQRRGWSRFRSSVKVACAQIVKNAQVTPALNVKSGKIDRMRLDYFGDTLVDDTVRSLLEPYVARKGA